MIKKELTFTVFDQEGQEVEQTETVRFLYSLPAVRLYEQRTGRNFFDDSQKAAQAFAEALGQAGLTRDRELTEEEQLALLPVLMEADLLAFLMAAIPCFYGEVVAGRFVQNELTAEAAEEAMWLGELINVYFYTELIVELNRHQVKVPQDRKKPQVKS